MMKRNRIPSNKRKSRILPAFLLVLLVASLVCTCKDSTLSKAPAVVTGIPPLLYFTRSLLGEELSSDSFLPQGSNPVTYEPSPAFLRGLKETKLFLQIGLPAERAWEDRLKANFPRLKIISLQSLISPELLIRSSHPLSKTQQSDSTRGPRKSNQVDPHFWLSPAIMLSLLQPLSELFARTFPEHTREIAKNTMQLRSRIRAVDEQIRGLSLQGRSFVVQHPSWSYFARDYGLQMISIETEGMESSPKRLRHILQEIHRLKIRSIFIQPEFSSPTARLIARESKAQVVHLSPLDEDWEGTLLRLAKEIKSNKK